MRRRSQSGYVMMVLLFMMALLLFATAFTAPAIKQQIQREREEEMIHRGAQYARAIKRFYKKFGRYPTSLDQLENTNNLRFLRKRYKDPMVPDGDWGLLHVGDVKLGTGASIGTPVSAMAAGGFGQPATSAFGQSSSNPSGQPGAASAPSGIIGSTTAPAGQSGAFSSGPGSPSSTAGSPSSFGRPGILGAAIIGVTSGSDKEGLHVFNEKTHYNEWYFVYDPTADRGGLIRGPFTGKTFQFGGAAGIGTPAGGIGTPAGGQRPGAFGQPSGFGQPAGQQPGGFGQPAPTPQKPPQPPQ